MPVRLTRRDALKTTAAIGAGYFMSGSSLAADESKSPNEKLNIAVIGIGGRGSANLGGVAGENIVALCDVDDLRAGKAYEKFPQAKKFYDFRAMYDELENQIDAVVISTPDHTHFHPAMLAMQMGKHCYCEKPMAHSVGEVRAMTEMARKMKVATQLGVQRHTIENMHRVVELIQAGAIGEVKECHSWVGGNRGMPPLPSDQEQVPSTLKWDLWLGPVAERPYHKTYAPYGWRFWWDFGTGEMGNWGCHILDIPYWALGLKHPTSVSASGPSPDPRRTPQEMSTRFEFPAAEGRGPVTLHWSHTKSPAILKEHGLSGSGANNLFIGSKGMLLCGFSMRKLLPEQEFAGYEAPAPTIAKSPGFYKEWITACKGGPAATCEFDYSGPMSETVLLGNAAFRSGGESFTWDAAQLKPSGNDQVEKFLHSEYRKGWELG